MSSAAHSLVTWEQFLRLPERLESGERYELHDGEINVVAPARPLYIKIQKRIEQLLESLAGDAGVVAVEFPYRPLPNLQYWVADVAYIPESAWDAMPADDYPVYAPALVVEVLSSSNTATKVNRQRIIALSAGTQEFWIVDAANQSVEVTNASGNQLLRSGDTLRAQVLGGAAIPVAGLFTV
ncbi:MAG: Uma2 family endonuclease [Acidobacteriaceae bacterium]|nr:Uma2 family endonuclease [Acidobacteriaceae bacterium]